MIAPLLPPYGTGTLADLAESLLSSLTGAGQNVLGLPATRRACLLIVDGLGWDALRGHQAAAPFLSELAFNGAPLSSGFPSTTVTSLGSLGTGCQPGQHGMLGYQVAIPGTGKLMNGLTWEPPLDPAQWQPLPTIYERAVAEGVAATHVAHGSLRGSGLTRATLRGARFRRANSMGVLAAETAAALQETSRSLVTAYHSELDSAGHLYGTQSDAWGFHLAHVDKLAEQIASAMPQDAMLYVTSDHGMVMVAEQDRIDTDKVPDLRAGVALLGGEPRARHVYAREGAAADVLAAWRSTLGEHAWVRSREEAIKEGWFGTVSEQMTDRIGDVVAAMAGTSAVVATEAEPRESELYGMHGSLTSDEQLIPMLSFGRP